MKQILTISLFLLLTGKILGNQSMKTIYYDALKGDLIFDRNYKFNNNKIKLKKNESFKLQIKYLKNLKLKIEINEKDIEYQPIEINNFNTKSSNKNRQQIDTLFEKIYQLKKDITKINIYFIDTISKDTNQYQIIVYAKNYMVLMPATGLSLNVHKNEKNYYYSPLNVPNNLVKTDSNYNYGMFSNSVGPKLNSYIGINFSYVMGPNLYAGLTTAFAYNFGTKENPFGGLLGGNISIGSKYKLTLGGGLSFKTITTQPIEIQQLQYEAKSTPNLPTGISVWDIGWFFNIGFTLATF